MVDLPPGARVITEEDLRQDTTLPPGATPIKMLEPPTAGERAVSAAGGSIIGMTKAVGAPVDTVNFLFGMAGIDIPEPTGGSQNIQRGLSELGLAPRVGEKLPDPFIGRVSEEVGAATAALVPFGAAARAGAVTKGMFAPLFESFRRNPAMFTLAELGLATTAGIGAATARELFPDQPAAELIGQLTGSFVGVPSVAIGNAAVKGIRRSVVPFTRRGAEAEAARRVTEVVQDPAASIEALRRGDPTGLLRTPAQVTEDPGLLALEQAVLRSSAELSGEFGTVVDGALASLKAQVSDVGGGVPVQRTAEFLAQRRGYVAELLDARGAMAVGLAKDRVDSLRLPGGVERRAEVGRVVRDEVESALSDARTQERDLWGAVRGRDIQAPTETLKETMQGIIGKQRKADRPENVPADIKRILLAKRNKDGKLPEGAFDDVESVDEILAFRSRILDDIRAERAKDAPNRRMIGNLEELQEAALDSLGALQDQPLGDVGEDIRLALDFSRLLNDKFTRGPVGRLLGFERAGGASIDPALTLERTMGKGGPAGDVELEALLGAVADPKNVGANASQVTRASMDEFLRLEFFRQATDPKTGQVLPGAARRFAKRNEQILERFPELRDDLKDATKAQDAADSISKSSKARKDALFDKRRSRTALFLDGPLDKEIARVLKSDNPRNNMQELVRQASKDPTGEAVLGLKTGFVEQMMGRAEMLGVAEAGGRASAERFLGGFQRNMKEFGEVINRSGLFTAEDSRRLRKLNDAAEKLERSLRAGRTLTEVIESAPNAMVDMLSRIVGARFGAFLAQGSEATLVGAARGSKLAREVTNEIPLRHVRRVIADAIFDPSLMETLLTRVTPRTAPVVRGRLRAHLVNLQSPFEREQQESKERRATFQPPIPR